MPLQVGVDVEELLIMGVLRPSADVQTAFGGADAHVHTDIPPDPAYPLVTVKRLGGANAIGGVFWHDRARIQYDVWADSREDAQAGAATVRAVLLASKDHDYSPFGRVTSVEETIAPFNQPDPASVRSRFIGEVIVSVHPLV
jgi:hypothetical protein